VCHVVLLCCASPLRALQETEDLDTPLAARCLQGLGLAYNGCGDAEAALEPLQAARRRVSINA